MAGDLFRVLGVITVALVFAAQVAHGLGTDGPDEVLAERAGECRRPAVKARHQAAQKAKGSTASTAEPFCEYPAATN